MDNLPGNNPLGKIATNVSALVDGSIRLEITRENTTPIIALVDSDHIETFGCRIKTRVIFERGEQVGVDVLYKGVKAVMSGKVLSVTNIPDSDLYLVAISFTTISSLNEAVIKWVRLDAAIPR